MGVNDVAFTLELLDYLSEQYCTDPARVYASGKSVGGGFTNILACDEEASRRFAAFAPVSGAYFQYNYEGPCVGSIVPITCAPSREIPILEFHGDADPVIAYNGGLHRGACLPSVPHFVRQWSKRDGLGLRNKTTSLFGGNVLEYQFGTGEELGLVTHYKIHGLGHAWPSTKPNSDNPNGTYFNATPIIMSFFDRYILPDEYVLNVD